MDQDAQDDGAVGNIIPAPRYRANRQCFFLTYPQCPLDPIDRIMDELFARFPGEIEKWLIAKELHEDGNQHIHLYLRFNQKKNFKDPRWADIDGYHPNDGGAIRSHVAVAKYCTKDGEWWCGPDQWFKAKTDPFAEAMAAENMKAAEEIIRTKRPRDYAMYWDRIQVNVKRALAKPIERTTTIIGDPEPWVLPDGLRNWLAEEYVKPNRARCLFLQGATKLGKTEWARSLDENHIFWRGAINIDKWEDDAKYIVIDDIEWQFIPNKKQLMTAMGECELTDKYRAKRTLINFKPCILCCNYNPFAFMTAEEDEYWRENAVHVVLENRLY